jgi:hypothetical protein
MPGGLMNLISYGNQNIILNGNPTKTFFKAAYMKYTNFGLQKFRINHEGQKQLEHNKDTHYTFKMPRYGDLLMDTYLVVKLPHIWSPLYKRSYTDPITQEIKYTYIPYEFKWIEEIGTYMIKEIRIRCGNTTLQSYSGEYISVLAKRDYSEHKRVLFNEMIGNTPALTFPALPYTNVNPALSTGSSIGYPTAFFDKTSFTNGGPEPSIRGRRLYIPIGAWFCNSSKQAYPMISSQYSELFIDVILRPLRELFVIRDVSKHYGNNQNSLSYRVYDSLLNDEIVEKLINEYNETGQTFREKLTYITTVPESYNLTIVNVNSINRVNYSVNINYNDDATIDTFIENILLITNIATYIQGKTPGDITTEFANINGFIITKFNYVGDKLIEQVIQNMTGPITSFPSFTNEVRTYNYVTDSNIEIDSIDIETDITVLIDDGVGGFTVGGPMTEEQEKTFDPPKQNDEVSFYYYSGTQPSFRDPTFLTDYPHIQPNFNLTEHALYRFLHPPPNNELNYTNADKRTNFNSDVHLISTYGFLTEEEGREFSKNEQSILIKDVHEYTIKDIVGTRKIELESTGLISNWTFFMRRSDAYIRNEWNNYTNWRYKYIKPQLNIDSESALRIYSGEGQLYDPDIIGDSLFYNENSPTSNFIEPPIEYYSSGSFNIENEKNILKGIEILLDGKIRENKMDVGVFQYIEPFQRTSGGYTEGLYLYNFGLGTDPQLIQPNGAINLSKYSKIEIELETELPPLDPDAEFNVVCTNVDDTAGNDEENEGNGVQIIGVNKEHFNLYKYTYDMRLFEEKYNVVNFVAGTCGLMFSR